MGENDEKSSCKSSKEKSKEDKEQFKKKVDKIKAAEKLSSCKSAAPKEKSLNIFDTVKTFLQNPNKIFECKCFKKPISGKDPSIFKKEASAPCTSTPKTDVSAPSCAKETSQDPCAESSKTDFKKLDAKSSLLSKLPIDSIRTNLNNAIRANLNKIDKETILNALKGVPSWIKSIREANKMKPPTDAGSSRRMKYPYTYSAKIAQFPLRFYLNNQWIWRYYFIALGVCLPIFWKIHRLANSPGNKAKWAEIKRREKEAAQHHH